MEKGKENKRQDFIITEKTRPTDEYNKILSIHLGKEPVQLNEVEKQMIQQQNKTEAKVQGIFTTDGFNKTKASE